jgi:hypothetical protein
LKDPVEIDQRIDFIAALNRDHFTNHQGRRFQGVGMNDSAVKMRQTTSNQRRPGHQVKSFEPFKPVFGIPSSTSKTIRNCLLPVTQDRYAENA